MKQKTLFPIEKIRFLQDSLLIESEILVLSDLHLGFEEQITGSEGFPHTQFRDIVNKLDKIFEQLKNEKIIIKQIIICGDLKHEFDKISKDEWRETFALFSYLDKQIDPNIKTNKIVLIKGNHDNLLAPILKNLHIQLFDYYKTKKICFLHGDKMYENWLNGCNMLIMGHLHPSITLKDKYKQEKYKCFLRGKWKEKEVFILPSFSDSTIGYDLNIKNDNNFLIIKNNRLKKFEVIIYNNKTNYVFGKLNKLIK
jgi:uncharacterized protein